MRTFHEPFRGSTLSIYQDLHLVVMLLSAPKDDGADGCYNMTADEARDIASALIEHADKVDTPERRKRRRELAYSLDPRKACIDYGSHSPMVQEAIDRIIAIEDRVIELNKKLEEK